MTKILRFDEEEDQYLIEDGLKEIWVEIDDAGLVKREIGFAPDGSVRHKYPGDGPNGRFGVFDLSQFEPTTPGELPVEEFERKWAEPRIASEAEFEEKPGIFRRLFSLLSGRSS